MRTIQQIRELRNRGKKKWGYDLYLHLQPLLTDNLTMEEISEWLEKKYDLSISVVELYAHVQYYRKKIQVLSEASINSTPNQGENLANHVIQIKEEIKEDDAFDFRIPVQKPKKLI